MAGEVIIEEYGNQIYSTDDNISGAGAPKLITTQVVTIASLSAQLNVETKYVRVQSNQTALWFKAGASDVSAVVDTDDNFYVPSDGFKELAITDRDGVQLYTYIDTAADA
jgi:hypothetical protein